jgi:hypothetical protein
MLLRPLLRHSSARNAYVLRLVGSNYGPVLRAERRTVRSHPSDGIERRASTA